MFFCPLNHFNKEKINLIQVFFIFSPQIKEFRQTLQNFGNWAKILQKSINLFAQNFAKYKNRFTLMLRQILKMLFHSHPAWR